MDESVGHSTFERGDRTKTGEDRRKNVNEGPRGGSSSESSCHLSPRPPSNVKTQPVESALES